MLLSMTMTTATMKMMARSRRGDADDEDYDAYENDGKEHVQNHERYNFDDATRQCFHSNDDHHQSFQTMLSWDNTVQYQQHWYRVSSTITSLPRHRVTLHRPAGQPEAFDLGLVPLGSHGFCEAADLPTSHEGSYPPGNQ